MIETTSQLPVADCISSPPESSVDILNTIAMSNACSSESPVLDQSARLAHLQITNHTCVQSDRRMLEYVIMATKILSRLLLIMERFWHQDAEHVQVTP
jgi:hypothetical protein